MSEKNGSVPVAEAEAIAERYRKTMVLILTYDSGTQALETIAYGATAAAQSAAAATALVVSRALGFR